MSIEGNLEEKIHRTGKKLCELSIHVQRLDREYEAVLEQIALTPEELKEFVGDPENFSPTIREAVRKEKKRLDERLNAELSQVRDPNKTKKVISERGTIQQHWLFVR